MAPSDIAVKETAIGLRLIIGVALMMVLAGCASTLSAKVTTFQQWPADAQGATYKVVPPAGNDLEVQAFADMIRAAMWRIGLAVSPPLQATRFDVLFSYCVFITEEWARRYHYP